MVRTLGLRIFAFVVCLAALPTIAVAQSQIAGTVKDESGGVLPIGSSLDQVQTILHDRIIRLAFRTRF